MKKRAILTFARGWNALAAARSLGRQGIEVVAGDENPFAPAGFSRYTIGSFLYPNPDRDPEGFLDKLEEVIRRYRPADGEIVLMPFHKETYLIAKHRARFEPLVKMAIPSHEQIEQVYDKGTLALYCRDRGVPMPETVVPRSRDEFALAAESFAYPAFVKVRRSAAAVGVKKVGSPSEAVEAFDRFVKEFGLDSPPLLQRGVGGDDYCATFLFDHGEPRAEMTYHNLRTYPVRSGTGVLRETVRAPRIEEIGRELLVGLKWHGVAEIDFRWDGRGDPWLIEVNPRFWGGLTQAVESGWDYPHLLYRLAVDGHVEAVKSHDATVRTETPVMAMLATLYEVIHDEPRMAAMKEAFDELKAKYVRGGRRRALREFVNNFKDAVDVKGRLEHLKALLGDHRGAVSDVFSVRDPLPALGLFYPLAVFLKHGKVSTSLLVSEGGKKKK